MSPSPKHLTEIDDRCKELISHLEDLVGSSLTEEQQDQECRATLQRAIYDAFEWGMRVGRGEEL